MFLGPLFGSHLYLNYGGKNTCDIIAMIDIIAGLTMAVFNCGPDVFSENKKFNKKLDRLKAYIKSKSTMVDEEGDEVYDDNISARTGHSK